MIKLGSFVKSPCFLPEVCKLSKKMHFLQFRAELSKKSMSVEAIYIYASESSHYILSENAMIYKGLSHRPWDISD